MCGIVAGVSYRNIVPILTEGLRRMEYRGYDSCGVAVVDDGELKRSRTVKRVQDLIRQTEEDEVKAHTAEHLVETAENLEREYGIPIVNIGPSSPFIPCIFMI